MSDKPNEGEPLDSEHYLVHLNHPCYEIDTWYVESEADIDAGKRQGYVTLTELRTMQARIAELEKQLQQAQTSEADYKILLSANADLKDENVRLTELLRGDRMIVATRINNELTTVRRRNIELEAAINGCAGQWTPMQDGAHYCGCDEEDCSGEWRIENNGSRLVIGDGESELSIVFYDAIRVCWQIQPTTIAQS